MGAELSDLAKLVVFHVPGPGCGEREMRDLLAGALGPDVLTTLTMVPLPRLASPGLLIAVDAYAMRGADGRRLARAPIDIPELASLPEPFCHGLRCEEFIFASGQSAMDKRGEVLFGGDLPSQNRHALDGVAAILDGLGASPGDIVKFNTWRAPPPSPQAYRRAAQDRFDFLAAAPPAVTGITIPETTGARAADPDGCVGDALAPPRTIAPPDPETRAALGLAVTDSLQPGSAMRPMGVRRWTGRARRTRQRNR